MKHAPLLALVALLSTPAAAQWQVENNAIPVGRGQGVVGFKSVLGSAGAGARCLIDTVPPTFAACPPGAGAALTKTDDTNVTLTLGGTPATSLLRAASLTLGWTGQLAVSRGGLGQDASGQTGIALNTAGTFTWLGSSGTGNVARVTSPVFVTPNLGTPSAIALNNATALSAAIDANFGSTRGSVLYRGASAWAALAPGTSGQFYTTQGAGADPIWSGGGAGTGTVTQVNCAGGVYCPPITSTGTIYAANSVMRYGAVCNGIQYASSSVSITTGTAALTVTGASFSPGDVGKVISIPGAGVTVSGVAGALNTTIATYTSATQVVLTTNASTTVSAAPKTVSYGSDDTTAFQAGANDTTTGSLYVNGPAACMLSDTVTFNTPKKIYGDGVGKSKVVFRQTTGTTGKATFTLASGSNGSSVSDMYIDADIGGQITSSTRVGIINSISTGHTFSGLELNGNRATQVQIALAGIYPLTDYSKVLNNYIHDFRSYPVLAITGASHLQISGNRLTRGPRVTEASAMVGVLSSGTIAPMSDIQITGNTVDTSDTPIDTNAVAYYVYGGNATTAAYNNVVIADNIAVGTAGSTASLSAGISSFYGNNVSITGNSISNYGEGIGSNNYNVTISGNALYGNGEYGIESNTEVGATISGNIVGSSSTTKRGITVENCLRCSVTGNTVNGDKSPVTFNGIQHIVVSGATGANMTISGNYVELPAGATGWGISVLCSSGANFCVHHAITGNNIDNASAAAGSVGVYIARSGGTMSQFLIGPNAHHQDVGTKIDAGVTSYCYLPGFSNSTTATSGVTSSSCQ